MPYVFFMNINKKAGTNAPAPRRNKTMKKQKILCNFRYMCSQDTNNSKV